MSNRQKGRVLFYHKSRGFGRIEPIGGGDSIHVHYTGLVGCKSLHKGQIVLYTVGENDYGTVATEVEEFKYAKAKSNTGAVSDKKV